MSGTSAVLIPEAPDAADPARVGDRDVDRELWPELALEELREVGGALGVDRRHPALERAAGAAAADLDAGALAGLEDA